MRASGARVEDYAEIGQRIKRCRVSAGISQAELSYRIGFRSPTAIFYIEQGKRRIKVVDLIEIAKALNVSADLLIFGREQMLPMTSPEPFRISEPVVSDEPMFYEPKGGGSRLE